MIKCFEKPINQGLLRVHILSLFKTKVELKLD